MAVDVLGIGCCAVDDVLYVDRYPTADSKARVKRAERRCGGLTSVALMTASRLGSTCQFAGALGDDELSRFACDSMKAFGVDISTVVKRPEARPVHSVIVVDESAKSRTILYNPQNVYGADPERPDAALIRSARVLFIDHYGTAGQIRAGHIAREAGIPVVADLEAGDAPRFGELLEIVDHLVLSRECAAQLTGHQDPAAAVQKLWHGGRAIAVVTNGRDGCWYVETASDGKAVHLPAFSVEAVDTTGCGDVFHGAYAVGVARGLPVRERLRLASAAAAIKATQAGGPAGIPSAGEVAVFLRERAEARRLPVQHEAGV